jgi:hypothetical protein
VQFMFAPNVHFILDDALWFCNGAPCTPVVPFVEPNPSCVAPIPPGTPPCGYALCCSLGTLPLPAQYTRFTLKLSTNYPTFDCSAFMNSFTKDTGLLPSQIIILSVTSGSTIIDAGMPDANAVTFAAAVKSGTQTVPNVQSFSTATGTSAPPGSGFPWWIILIVMLIILAAVAVVLFICYRRRKQSGGGSASKDYVAISDAPRSNYDAPSSYAAYAAPVPAPSGFVTVKLLFDVQDHGENVLPARKGDVALVTPEDLAATSDWVFVKIGNREGYVPRLSLSRT